MYFDRISYRDKWNKLYCVAKLGVMNEWINELLDKKFGQIVFIIILLSIAKKY